MRLLESIRDAFPVTDPTALFVLFIGFVGLVFFLAKLRPLQKVFRYLPPIVWIYLLPAVATTAGLIPAKSPFYDWCRTLLLPFALLLLTMCTDVKAIARLGPLALAMFLAGTLGVVLGAPIALLLFQSQLDPDAWMGMGSLSGSWIGGTSNMVAIKESINCPDHILAPYIVVDTVVGYGWMLIMIALARWQDAVDRRNKANREILDDLNRRLTDYNVRHARPLTLSSLAVMLGVGFVGGYLCMWLGRQIPEVGAVFSHTSWGILLVVGLGLALSFTPARRLEDENASAVAYAALYLMVATIGAGGDLRQVLGAPLVLLVGVVWLAIHVAVMLIALKLLRAPFFLFATGSMANIGGVVSAPIVAGVYQKALAPVGVAMGVLGNILGTPVGLLCAQWLSWTAG